MTPAPTCLVCFPRIRPGQRLPLAHGVAVSLCREHRDPQFLTSDAGRDALLAVGALLEAAGVGRRRYEAAVLALLRQITAPAPPPRRRPGSYGWSRRRRDAEAVWGAGGSFEDGLRSVLDQPPPPGMTLPSRHTVRRWWRERRWLGAPADVVELRSVRGRR